MKIQSVTPTKQTTLLKLMRESHEKEAETSSHEWDNTRRAIKTLLCDSQAGEAYFILDDKDQPIGYMIMCRGFSLDYGGYFTWIEETYVRKSAQKRFRDQRFSP